MTGDRLFSFVGGAHGAWRVTKVAPVIGESLASVDFLEPKVGSMGSPKPGWVLRGITSHPRYVTAQEQRDLQSRQEGIGRPAATCAALIPIRKSPEWWSLAQDERRRIFEESSQHIQIGMEYLPGIARRLHHCRDLGPDEPFDFLTWFEYSPADALAFEDLVMRLRRTLEWRFVIREVDLRAVRVPTESPPA